MERRTTSQPRKCLHCKEKYTIWLNLMRKHYNERGRPAKPPSRRTGRHWDLLIKFTLAATVPQKCVEWHLPAKVKLKIVSPWQAIRNRVRSTPSSLPKWIGGSPRACNIPRYFSVWRRTLSRANVAIALQSYFNRRHKMKIIAKSLLNNFADNGNIAILAVPNNTQYEVI